ncbi:MAG: hypothetical protein OEV93_03570 [Candidatus Moranbacteria bacterium]|nr:hypothetical protein [Candidatus Moranbacteria bacterium]
MEIEFFFNTLEFLGGLFEGLYNSRLFLFVKFFLGIYTLVLFVDLVLLLVVRGLGSDIRIGLKGAEFPTESKGKFLKKWSGITSRLNSDNVSQYKVSILEADKIVEDVLSKTGYSGENMTEKLKNVTVSQIGNIEDLRRAHEIRNDIIYDKNYDIDLEKAREVLNIYEEYLKEIELL